MRLIDADAIPELFDKEYKTTKLLIEQGEEHLDNLAEGFTEAHSVIQKMPTIEAEPIVYAKWIKGDMNFEYDNYCCLCYNWNCSNCGETVSDRHWLPRYCPNCGAKMGGERKTNATD